MSWLCVEHLVVALLLLEDAWEHCEAWLLVVDCNIPYLEPKVVQCSKLLEQSFCAWHVCTSLESVQLSNQFTVRSGNFAKLPLIDVNCHLFFLLVERKAHGIGAFQDVSQDAVVALRVRLQPLLTICVILHKA